jgi:poly(A) polymerase
MIRKFIDKLLGKSPAPAAPVAPAKGGIPLGKRLEVPASEHKIDPAALDERAVKVVQTLQEGGHQAYIVGGAVRDLLVGLRPKDFDVATDATPEQVKALFRRAFIIGRRFRLVHVIFGRGRDHEVIEVSTFRAFVDATEADQVPGNEKTSRTELAGRTHAVDASGRVLRDNVWGPQIEDAARRDFTINAMYYDPQSQVLVDYHHGVADARKKLLRMIGDPATRYREDPVRIVRIVRFAAKLGFEIERHTAEPIRRMAPLLANVPASRLFDEMFKLLQTGHALRSLDELRKQGLHQGVFPILDGLFAEGPAHTARQNFMRLALQDTDRRVAEDRTVVPSFLLACLLWHDALERWTALRAEGVHATPALQQAIDAVFDARIGDISGRGRLAADMREIWMMQTRFERRTGNSPHALVEQPRFRAGYDFLRLRCDAGEAPPDLAEWWEDFSLGTAEEREALIAAMREVKAPRRRSEPRPPAQAVAATPGAEPAEAALATEGVADDAPRKRRRRRRSGSRAAAGEEPVAPLPDT